MRKYDPDGAELWTRQFGTSSIDGASDVTTDGSGNVFVSGGSAGALETQVGGDDTFVRKYDPNGTILWTRQSGSHSDDTGYAVRTDREGNVIVAGTVGNDDNPLVTRAFVRKYTAAGAEAWFRQVGGSFEEGYSVDVDRDGAVFIAGRTATSLPGQMSQGYADSFVRKYDAMGAELWTQQLGTPCEEYVTRVAVRSTAVFAVATYRNPDATESYPRVQGGYLVTFER